jgi:hypothetical protein
LANYSGWGKKTVRRVERVGGGGGEGRRSGRRGWWWMEFQRRLRREGCLEYAGDGQHWKYDSERRVRDPRSEKESPGYLVIIVCRIYDMVGGEWVGLWESGREETRRMMTN